jgi:multisubunit Na+/H+ antiporter MnhE subunit
MSRDITAVIKTRDDITFTGFMLGLVFAFVVGAFVSNHITGKEKKELVRLQKSCELEYARDLYKKAGGK